MHVCHLVNSLEYGGAETHLVKMTRENQTADTDFLMSVCAIEQNAPLTDEFREIDIEVQNFGATFKFDPRSIARMVKYFNQNRFDILHIHLPLAHTLGRLVGRMSGIDIIVSTQHNVANNYNPITGTLEKLTRPLDTRTVAVSEGVRQSFSTPFHGSGHSWETIYNGIDVEAFNEIVNSSDPSEVKEKWEITNELVFLNVARYQPAKSQADLIDAMEEVTDQSPNTKLLIVGRGKLENKLRQRIQEKGMEAHVKLTGFVPSIVEYYALADVFVSSSIREGHPITLLEAMAAELPVVGTAIPGVNELVVDCETGFLAPSQSPTALADRLLGLMDTTKRQQFGQASFKRVRDNFDISDTLDSHIELYKEVLDTS
jgi:glycosyltransferase involved in cell wall biosynthesis